MKENDVVVINSPAPLVENITQHLVGELGVVVGEPTVDWEGMPKVYVRFAETAVDHEVGDVLYWRPEQLEVIGEL